MSFVGKSSQAPGKIFTENGEMPITSSPIEGRLIENPIFNQNIISIQNTWGGILNHFKVTGDEISSSKVESWLASLNSDHEDDRTQSSYEPIAEHRAKLVVTPNRGIRVRSDSARKLRSVHTPKSSYCVLNTAHQSKKKEIEGNKSKILEIKKILLSKENLTLKDIEKYENVLKSFLTPKEEFVKEHSDSEQSHGLLQYMNQELEGLVLTPNTGRLLKSKQWSQEKRLISLAVAKRKSASQIRSQISNQQKLAQDQIKKREAQELKLQHASRLRQESLEFTKLTKTARSAHYGRVVRENRRQKELVQLRQQMESEKLKRNQQTNQIVKDVWDIFAKEQYNVLQEEIRLTSQQQKQLAKEMEIDLKRMKASYEEKLKRMKEIAAQNAKDSGLKTKEMAAELRKIETNLREHYNREFQNLLHKIQQKGYHERFIREEKAAQLKEDIKKAKFTFNL